MKEIKATMDKIVNLCKNRGFIFPGSDIYGGMGNTWDYGPVGVEFKNNIKRTWWKRFVQENQNTYGVDAAILMNSRVWEASGHTTSFSDPKMDCKNCKTRHRADNLIEAHSKGKVNPDTMSTEEMEAYINEHKVACPKCGKFDWTNIRQFNLMFETSRGVTEEGQNKIYLRPETAQGEFVNFLNVQRSCRAKVPFGVAQIGKAFRNEITPGNFIFRTREFEQMELEFFCKPGTDLEWFKYWKEFAMNFLKQLGLKEEELRFRDHDADELSFYSNATSDIEFLFPWGFGELWGVASRTNYDLKQHQEHSKQNLEYLDPETNEKYIPYVIEPSLGVERLLLSILFSAYEKQKLENDEREVMHFHPALAPYKACVLPLMKKYHSEKAYELYGLLAKHFNVTYDDTASIGKRYRRQDAIGTPLCITVDDNTLNDGTVTIRNRDTMEQIILKIEELVDYINKFIQF